MKRPKLRTPENGEHICRLIAEGNSLRQVAKALKIESAGSITDWIREDAEFAVQYARATELRCQWWAEEILEISDADYTGSNGFVDNAAVQQARLKSDNRKWLLSKLLPKQFGDKITQELVGDPNAPVVTRIELVPVSPAPRSELPAPDGGGEATVSRLRALPSRTS